MTELAPPTDSTLAPADQWTTDALVDFVRQRKAALDQAVVKISEVMRTTASQAWYVGMALAILKDRVGHGEWQAWVAEHIPELSIRTVSTYIRLYTHWSDAQSIAGLSLSKALRMVQVAASSDQAPADTANTPRAPRVPSTALKTRPQPGGAVDPADDAAVTESIQVICQRLALDDIGELIARRIMNGQGDSEIAKELTQRARQVSEIHARIKEAAEELGLAE